MQPLALPPPAGAGHYEMPRPSPEGDLLIAREGDGLNGYDYVAFANVAGAWTATPITLPSLPRTGFLSQPSAAPSRHMLFVDAINTLEELVDDGTDTWTVIATYDARALGGVATPATPSLSGDGLRMVLTGYPSGGSISCAVRGARPRDGHVPAAGGAGRTGRRLPVPHRGLRQALPRCRQRHPVPDALTR